MRRLSVRGMFWRVERVNSDPSKSKTSHMLTRLSLFAFGLFGIALFSALTPVRATLITGWNFQNDVAAPNTTPATSTGTGSAASLGFNNTYSANGTSTDSSDVFLTTKTADQGSSDPVAAASNGIWRVRGGGGTSINGWNSAAPIGTQGAMFSAPTTGFTNIQVQFDWYCTTAGEQNLQAQYTLDGANYINVPAGLYSAAAYASVQAGVTAGTNTLVLTNTTSPNTVLGAYLKAPAQGWTDGISINLSSIAGANNDANFGIRLVSATTGADDTDTTGAALNNTSGNWRFDEVNISGVPEPGTFVLAGLGLTSVAMLARRRTRTV